MSTRRFRALARGSASTSAHQSSPVDSCGCDHDRRSTASRACSIATRRCAMSGRLGSRQHFRSHSDVSESRNRRREICRQPFLPTFVSVPRGRLSRTPRAGHADTISFSQSPSGKFGPAWCSNPDSLPERDHSRMGTKRSGARLCHLGSDAEGICQ